MPKMMKPQTSKKTNQTAEYPFCEKLSTGIYLIGAIYDESTTSTGRKRDAGINIYLCTAPNTAPASKLMTVTSLNKLLDKFQNGDKNPLDAVLFPTNGDRAACVKAAKWMNENAPA